MPTDALAPRPHYRRDIDGLRAFAILPVVFYHYGVPGFSGGFVGVDIFFVISGYLITGLLTSPERPLGFVAFYSRRIRRLLPALAAVLIVTTAAALILLPASALITFGGSLASVGLAGSNVFFWRKLASYFAVAGENHPLLHTWSLAVEEQFYFLFPLFLRLMDRFGPRIRLICVIGLCLLSFALAAWFAPRAPSASFYLLPTRAWELLAGGTLSLMRPPSRGWVAGAMGVVGLALIGFAVATFNAQSQVPGIAALAPCLGALLLLHIGQASPGNPVSRFLGWRPLVGIGLISYALYLWHWPINVFLRRYILFDPPAPALIAAEIALAIGAASLSWFLIERPLRTSALLKSPRRAFVFAAAMSLILVVAGLALRQSGGLPGRFPNLPAVAMQAEPVIKPLDARGPYLATGNPATGWLLRPAGNERRRVLVWGDSYARHLLPGFATLGADADLAVYQHVEDACPPVIGYRPASLASCAPHNDQAFRIIRDDRIDTVVLGGRWESYTSTGKLRVGQIGETVQQLKAMGLTVVLIGQPPTYVFDLPDEYQARRVRAHLAGIDRGQAINTADPKVNQALNALADGALFDPTPVFCQTLCLYRDQGLYLVSDAGHLTEAGSQRLVSALLASSVFTRQAVTP